MHDARLMGYEFYQCFDYSLSLGSKADCPDRYPSRFNEIIESCRIIRLILNLRSYEVMYYSCYSLARCFNSIIRKNTELQSRIQSSNIYVILGGILKMHVATDS